MPARNQQEPEEEQEHVTLAKFVYYNFVQIHLTICIEFKKPLLKSYET